MGGYEQTCGYGTSVLGTLNDTLGHFLGYPPGVFFPKKWGFIHDQFKVNMVKNKRQRYSKGKLSTLMDSKRGAGIFLQKNGVTGGHYLHTPPLLIYSVKF